MNSAAVPTRLYGGLNENLNIPLQWKNTLARTVQKIDVLALVLSLKCLTSVFVSPTS
jgi:hypothetical protein